MLFTKDGHNLWDADMYKGRAAFLILSGPSFGDLLNSSIQIGDKTVSVRDSLKMPGFVTMSTNNSMRSFRTDLWVGVDSPNHFMKSIFLDPKVRKFIPFCHAESKLFDNEKWQETDILVSDCPNVCFFRRNDVFNHEQFLTENTINWGNSQDLGGGRTVMLAALRLLYYIGIRRIFLLGCDFNMSDTSKYHFEQDRTAHSMKNNNYTYEKMIERFALLKPVFERHGLEVFNCNPASKLQVFDYVSYQDAYNMATCGLPLDWQSERTSGLYERMSLIKEEEKRKEKEKKKAQKPSFEIFD